ncbi:MAG TPA: zf-HC2 domain-containing protein [Solirubrobacteraceae bacterium]|nr:zf-HC2 domain-containing protein [Solirubrobacteraceae bacterium]
MHRAQFKRDHRWTPRRMSEYLDGDLDARRRARLERHTDECPECRGLLGGLRRLVGALRELGRPQAAGRGPDLAEAVGRRLGDFPRL